MPVPESSVLYLPNMDWFTMYEVLNVYSFYPLRLKIKDVRNFEKFILVIEANEAEILEQLLVVPGRKYICRHLTSENEMYLQVINEDVDDHLYLHHD